MTPAQAAAVVHDSCVEAFGMLARHAPDGHRWRHRGLSAALTGAPAATFNTIASDVHPASADDTIVAIEKALTTCARPALWVRCGIDDAMVDAATTRGFGVIGRSPGMIIGVDQVADEMPAGLRLDVRGGADALETHIDLVAAAFGIPRSYPQTFTTAELLDDAAVVTAIGTVDGEPVCTALGIMTTGPAVCVFNVATAPDARGRGYGGAVTAFVARQGGLRGATHATLQSTEAGFSVYRRLGFAPVVDYEIWAAPAGGDHTSNSAAA